MRKINAEATEQATTTMIVEEFPLLLSLSLARTALQSKHTLGSSSLFLFSLTMMFSRDDDDDDGKTTARGC